MKRDIDKQIAEGTELNRTRQNIDLTTGDLKELYSRYREYLMNHGAEGAFFEISGDIYYMGLAVGYRAGLRDAKKSK